MIIATLRQWAIENAQIAIDAVPMASVEGAAERLLDYHLDPENYRMPVQDAARDRDLLEACATGRVPLPASRFEDTDTLVGIFRVLLRTRLNAQGIANVTRDATYKTLSPRVMGVLGTLPTAELIKGWLDWQTYIAAWINHARANDAAHALDLQFNDSDLDALNAMSRLTQAQALDPNTHIDRTLVGWERVVLGSFSGLHYLNLEYGLDPLCIWEKLNRIAALPAPAQAHAVRDAISQFARCVREFGKALSGSFYADLGHPDFVKSDTHVIDVCTSALRLGREATNEQCIDFCQNLAAAHGMRPRAVDKLAFFACSGNFYLTGIKGTPDIGSRKVQLLETLKQLPD